MKRRHTSPKATAAAVPLTFGVAPEETPPHSESGFSEDAFWQKITKLPAKASSRLIYQALILYCLLTDRTTPAWARALIVAALVYLINPFDLVPDALPGLGLADDAAAIALLFQRVSAYVTPAIEARAAKLVPWNKSSDAEASLTLKKTQRNRKGKNREATT